MLSRVADSVFWMSRYLERAENVARFIDVNVAISLGGHSQSQAQWAPLVYASGDEKRFTELYGEITQENVLRFLIYDERNDNSVLSSLSRARENARTIRDILPNPMWEAINRYYLRVRDSLADAQRIIESPRDFLERAQRSGYNVIGVTEATMSHGEAYSFGQLGRLIERADKTSRILDVKYFVLLPSLNDIGTVIDVVQWSALLESTGALHMYRKRFGRIEPQKVAEFLVLDRHFPRSLRFCVNRAEEALRSVTESRPGAFSNRSEQLLGQLNAQLSFTRIEDIVAGGLHEFVDELQSQLNDIGAAIFHDFFEIPPADSQSQSRQ